MFREIILTMSYGSVKLLSIGTVEWEVPKAHGIQNDAQTPDISFEAVVRLTTQHLRRCVTRAPTGRTQILLFRVNVTEPKIDNFDVEFPVQQNILRLQIPMGHTQRMNVLHSIQKLLKELTSLKFSQFFIIENMLEQLPS